MATPSSRLLWISPNNQFRAVGLHNYRSEVTGIVWEYTNRQDALGNPVWRRLEPPTDGVLHTLYEQLCVSLLPDVPRGFWGLPERSMPPSMETESVGEDV